MDSNQVRSSTIKYLNEYGIEHGAVGRPLLLDISKYRLIKSSETIYCRAMALFGLLCVQFETPKKKNNSKKQVVEWLGNYNLLEHLSDYENQYLLEGIKPPKHVKLSDRVEALYALMWALGLIEMDVDHYVPDNLVNLLPNIEKNRDPYSLYNDFDKKTQNQILLQLDINYYLHWKVI